MGRNRRQVENKVFRARKFGRSAVLVIVVVIHYKLIYISSIIGDVHRYSELDTTQLLVY